MRARSGGAFFPALCSESRSLPDYARIFAPFIGGWDLIVRRFDESGAIARTQPGERHISWVLEGRGVQDVWIVPPRGRRAAGDPCEYGTSIRFYDPGLGAWQSRWIGPMHRVVRTSTARRRGDDVVLETAPDVSPAMRWRFCDSVADALDWKNQVRDGEGWRVQQTFAAVRQGHVSPWTLRWSTSRLRTHAVPTSEVKPRGLPMLTVRCPKTSSAGSTNPHGRRGARGGSTPSDHGVPLRPEG